MPGHALLLPRLEPLKLRARLHEVLHLHLLELAHAEDELAGHDFIAEGLADLRDAEGQLHAARLLHVQVVHEDSLGRFGTQVYGGSTVVRRTDLRLEHQVELAHVRPVVRAADGAHDALVQDDLLQLRQVVGVHRVAVTLVQGVALLLVLQHAGIGLAELLLVEALAELLSSLGHFLVYLFVVFGYLVFNQHVGTVALLAVAVVNQRVVERIHVPAGLPRRGMHEDGGVDAHDVLVEQHHALPPILFNVILQLHAVLTVVVHGTQTIINLTRREHEPVLLTM